MNNQATNPNAPKITKETKNKIRVEFERTDAWTRFKLKYLTTKFLKQVIWVIFRLVLLVGISFVILSPLISKIFSSFMGKEDFVDVTVKYIAKYPTLEMYRALITENHYAQALLNTALLSVFCALVQTFICTLVGYGFAKFKFKFNKLLFFLVIFTMVIPQRTLKLSMFLNFKNFDFFAIITAFLKMFGYEGNLTQTLFGINANTLNLLNTFWPVAILSLGGLAFKNGLYIFMMRQYFKGVPDELEESAYLDGSGVFRTFMTIIIPLSVPMMITIFLFAFSWQWTDMFYTELFFTKSSITMMPDIVKVIPKSLIDPYPGQSMREAAIKNTGTLLIIAPLVLIYLFCQRYLIAGIERSGIVG